MLAKLPEAAVEGIIRSEEQNPDTNGILATLAFGMLLSSLGTSIANVALPAIATGFNASFQSVQWVVLAYLLAITSLIVSAGNLGDLMGRRRLLLSGIGVFVLASIIGGLAQTLWLLIVARAAQGIGVAFMLSLTMAIAGETVPKARTGAAMGLLGTMSALGTALGPTLGGILIAGAGWRGIFVLNGALGMLLLLVAYRYLPRDRADQGKERAAVDALGTVLLAWTLGAYAMAMTSGRDGYGWLNVALMTTAALGLGLFVAVEKKTKSPLLRLSMFGDRELSVSLVLSTVVSIVMMATLVVGPFYLSRALGLKPAMVGVAMSIGPVVAALAGMPAGRIADRWGAQQMTTVGLSGVTVGAMLLSVLPGWLGLSGYLASITMMTAGYAIFQTANNTVVMAKVLPNQRGVVSGMLNLSRNLGLITGASAMGTVFALASATSDITTATSESVATGMRLTFAIAAGLVVCALVLSVGSRPKVFRTSQQGTM